MTVIVKGFFFKEDPRLRSMLSPCRDLSEICRKVTADLGKLVPVANCEK